MLTFEEEAILERMNQTKPVKFYDLKSGAHHAAGQKMSKGTPLDKDPKKVLEISKKALLRLETRPKLEGLMSRCRCPSISIPPQIKFPTLEGRKTSSCPRRPLFVPGWNITITDGGIADGPMAKSYVNYGCLPKEMVVINSLNIEDFRYAS
ncbi:hypothetical protein NE237_012843 [Protea cynaroides]|uniref:Uncharacterized protein n=1 Tax=Protea cynaroides TaxID=273540 RepID=A0A9Q0JZ82_9MAGN|nr:hypothetical protein NE237_012843 [Protea cynaroides]